MQTQRVRPPIVERSMATSAFLDSPIHSESDDLPRGLSQAEINVLCEAMSVSLKVKLMIVSRFWIHNLFREPRMRQLEMIMHWTTWTNPRWPVLLTSSLPFPRHQSTQFLKMFPQRDHSPHHHSHKLVFRRMKRLRLLCKNVQKNSETKSDSRRQNVDVCTEPCGSQLVDRSVVTSPVIQWDRQTVSARRYWFS